MKKLNKNNIIKLSETFDKQLLNILSQELAGLKNTKNQFIKTFNSDSGNGLLVA